MTEQASSKDGIQLIADERTRQIEEWKFSAEHDDAHDRRELARAAKCYLDHYIARQWLLDGGKAMQAESRIEPPEDLWPWEESAWKPKDRISDLIRAGALIAAEIDRLQRRKEEKS